MILLEAFVSSVLQSGLPLLGRTPWSRVDLKVDRGCGTRDLIADERGGRDGGRQIVPFSCSADIVPNGHCASSATAEPDLTNVEGVAVRRRLYAHCLHLGFLFEEE